MALPLDSVVSEPELSTRHALSSSSSMTIASVVGSLLRARIGFMNSFASLMMASNLMFTSARADLAYPRVALPQAVSLHLPYGAMVIYIYCFLERYSELNTLVICTIMHSLTLYEPTQPLCMLTHRALLIQQNMNCWPEALTFSVRVHPCSC